MKLKFFSPHWGYEDLDFSAYCRKVADAGYDGIEMNLPEEANAVEHVLDVLENNGLELLAQHSGTQSTDFEEHLAHYRKSLERITAYKPQLLNSHTGRDFFTPEQNLQIIDAAAEISAASHVPIVHETHRGRFCYSAALTQTFLEARPGLRLTADFSHWCCVSESFLQGQEQFVETAIQHADHIHSRIGHDQGPQVNDPRAPEWQDAVNVFLGWWDRIVETHQSKGSSQLTITTEFGPWPYLPELPYTRQPISSQWNINLHMMELLRNRYGA